jgi:hypothetical protein
MVKVPESGFLISGLFRSGKVRGALFNMTFSAYESNKLRNELTFLMALCKIWQPKPFQ